MVKSNNQIHTESLLYQIRTNFYVTLHPSVSDLVRDNGQLG